MTQHHAKPSMTIAQTRQRLVIELQSCTDAALALKSAEGLHRGSYTRLRLGDIAEALRLERALRELPVAERFALALRGMA